MWCGRKGIDCSYCGAFGECQRSACYLPIVEPSMIGAPIGLCRQHTDRNSIDDIKLEAVKEFAEKLKIALNSCIVEINVDGFIDDLLKEYENE